MLVYEGVFSGVLAALLGSAGYLILMACLTPENIGYTSWPMLLGGAAVCILLSALAVLFPARQALNIPPIEGIPAAGLALSFGNLLKNAKKCAAVPVRIRKKAEMYGKF